MNKRLMLIISFMLYTLCSMCMDKNLLLLKSFLEKNEIDMKEIYLSGKIIVHKTDSPTDKGIANEFTFVRSDKDLFYADEHNILLSKETLNLWVNKKINYITLNVLVKSKKQEKKLITPTIDFLPTLEKSIKTCEILNDGNTTTFIINYNPGAAYKLCKLFFENDAIKSVAYYHNEGFDYAYYEIKFSRINKPDTESDQLFDPNKYVEKIGDSWKPTNEFNNCSLQIIQSNDSF